MTGHDALTIYWMTDLHIKDQVTGRPDHADAIYRERHYYASVDKLREAVDAANEERPDLFICTGDVVDGVQPLTSFLEHWNRIGCFKEFIPGNHDLDNGYFPVVKQLGYEGRAVVAGSNFNRSFRLAKGSVQARVILLDTYVGENGEHRYGSCLGTIEEDAFEWLEHELSECPEPLILLFAHNGIGGPEPYFDQSHVKRFIDMASRLDTAENRKTIVQLAGHHHVHPTAVVKELSPNLTFINGVAMIAGEQSYLNVLHVEEDGSVRISYRKVGYRG
jgi:3',5'-cyclic AMP phosphodiesterase CpdA